MSSPDSRQSRRGSSPRDNEVSESHNIIIVTNPSERDVLNDEQKQEDGIVFNSLHYMRKADYRDFIKFKRFKFAYFDAFTKIFFLVVFMMAFFTRANIYRAGTFQSPFVASFSLSLIGLVIFAFILVMTLARFFLEEESRWAEFAQNFLKTSWRRWADESLPILAALATGCNLIARVNAGQCSNHTTIWASQECNPVADLNSVPHDSVILCYLVPVVFQLLLKGIRVPVIVCSWGIGVAFILAAIVTVNGVQQIWTILYSPLFLYISLEVERVLRILYVQNRRFLRAKADAVQHARMNTSNVSSAALDKARHDLKIVCMQAEKDKQEMELERERLRSMVGNVAHDLKTPLQSIGMGIELLRHDLSTALTTIAPTLEIQQALNEMSFKSTTLTLDNLVSMNSFMRMSINRCLDFTKASSGIGLTPMMETVEVADALQVPITCIRNLQSDTKIVVDPFPEDLCPFLITDKQWMMENLLCLLSNAVKYSTGGIVNITLELDVQAHEFLNHKVLRITVQDSGIGIPDDAKAKLFQPFRQAQKMAGGTGLGLYSLSKRLEALGGTYGVRDRKDGKQGSAFWYSFPYRPDSMSATSLETKRDHNDLNRENRVNTDAVALDKDLDMSKGGGSKTAISGSTAKKTPRERNLSASLRRRSYHADVKGKLTPVPAAPPRIVLCILIVEDSLSILKVVRQMLTGKGHRVETAANGSIGLDRMMKGHSSIEFDIVLMDLQMPVMDGIEATRRYREYEKQNPVTTFSAASAISRMASHASRASKASGSANVGLPPQDSNVEDKAGDADGDKLGGGAGGGGGVGETERTMKNSREFAIPKLPIIGMSANNDTLSKDGALEAGMNLFLEKPFTIKNLEDVLDTFGPRKRPNMQSAGESEKVSMPGIEEAARSAEAMRKAAEV